MSRKERLDSEDISPSRITYSEVSRRNKEGDQEWDHEMETCKWNQNEWTNKEGRGRGDLRISFGRRFADAEQ